MANADVKNGALAAMFKVSDGTVVNWRTGATLPSEAVRAQLARIFPGYDQGGDAVEVALARTGLVEWRRRAVMAEYERHLYEQGHASG